MHKSQIRCTVGWLCCLLVLILNSAISASGQSKSIQMVDADATAETRALYVNLLKVAPDALLFGQQEPTYTGRDFKDRTGLEDRADVHDVTGSYPAVYGWDFNSGITAFETHVKRAYERGGINTYSWHMFNPVTGKNFYDTTPAVSAILPDGDKHEVYKQQLDHIAGYFNNLKDDMGRHIPIIFRPFHENTGSWFWWGAKHCTPDEYKALWRFTVEYLRDVKQVHNLLWAYSPSKPTQQSEGYLVRYPGDVWVDIIGADHYRPLNKDSWPEALLLDARLLVRLAEKRGKVAAITEAGISKGLANANSDDVFTQKILEPIKNDPVAKHLAYFMTWRNQNRNSNDKYWIPVEGDSLLPDFIKFHADPFMLFEDNIPDMYRMPK